MHVDWIKPQQSRYIQYTATLDGVEIYLHAYYTATLSARNGVTAPVLFSLVIWYRLLVRPPKKKKLVLYNNPMRHWYRSPLTMLERCAEYKDYINIWMLVSSFTTRELISSWDLRRAQYLVLLLINSNIFYIAYIEQTSELLHNQVAYSKSWV